MEEHSDSAYGGAYARNYTDEASELLCPEDLMPVDSDPESAAAEEADPFSREELEKHGFNWTLYPDESYVDPCRVENSGSESDTGSVIVTHVIPAGEAELRRRRFIDLT